MPKYPKLVILNIITYLIFSCAVLAQGLSDSILTSTNKTVVKITRKWELPPALKEISGISYIDADRLASVQDEVGSIFIYNISSKTLESEIPFAPPGDYEGIALVNEDAYVACADGRLYEISGYNSSKPVVKEYGTHLTVKQNVEGICYDKKNKRLLVAIKGREEGSALYKGIYSFDLATKTMLVKPVMKIDLQDSVFNKSFTKKIQMVIQPSEINIHPLTGDIYITDGDRSQLLIMDNTGKIKMLYALDRAEFNQPEGIMFTPSGELYIANEGNKQLPGTLVLVELDN